MLNVLSFSLSLSLSVSLGALHRSLLDGSSKLIAGSLYPARDSDTLHSLLCCIHIVYTKGGIYQSSRAFVESISRSLQINPSFVCVSNVALQLVLEQCNADTRARAIYFVRKIIGTYTCFLGLTVASFCPTDVALV